jgi:hypothetical protein
MGASAKTISQSEYIQGPPNQKITQRDDEGLADPEMTNS